MVTIKNSIKKPTTGEYPKVQQELVEQEEQQQHQFEAIQQEQQAESVEHQNAAKLPKHPLANNSNLTAEEELLASIEVVEKGIAWYKNKKLIVPKQKLVLTETEGAVTVVNDRNSKRVKLKNIMMEGLGYPDYIKFYVTDDEFVVQASTADEEGSYKLRLEGKRKCIIYNSEVIELLTEMFDLDFTKSTSQTFGEVKFENIHGVKYAVVFKEV